MSLFSTAFRLFFLLASVWGALGLGLWLHTLFGGAPFGLPLPPFAWHAHEMVFGYTLAVITGFLLTAASRWTGQRTVGRAALALLAGGWVVARLAVLTSSHHSLLLTAVVCTSFTLALAVPVARVVLVSENWRNLVFVALIVVLALGQALFFLEYLVVGVIDAGTGIQLALDAILLMIVVVSGRILPTFTRNATGDERVRNVPTLDRLALISVALLGLIELVPGAPGATILALTAGSLTAWRARAWYTVKIWRDPLLWVLHLGIWWIPISLLCRSARTLWPATATLGVHTFTLGAIGMLTLGMMSRVTLGHTGRTLRAPGASVIGFCLVLLATLVRAGGVLAPGSLYLPSLAVTGSLWMGAFCLFLLAQGKMLVQPRVDGKPG